MTPTTVSLVLGSGGARGYAHIGAIEELRAQGYDIRSVAGASMGALVGGIYAAGKLEVYRDWVKALQRVDVLRLLDWSFRGGLIKGDRIIEKLKELIGNVDIEALPISYTAVAVDLLAHREVWFARGPLFDAIRASIAIPAIFRPHQYKGRTLVDGGLLNPLPITPTLRDLTDCTIAVDVNASAEPAQGDLTVDDAVATPAEASSPSAIPAPPEPPVVAPALEENAAPGYRQRIAEFIDGFKDKRGGKPVDKGMGILELFALSLDTVQETVTRFKLAAQPPDLVISVPRNTCTFYEFARAEELIEIGRLRTREALRGFRQPTRQRRKIL